MTRASPHNRLLQSASETTGRSRTTCTDQKTAEEFVQEVHEQIQEQVQEQEPQVDDCDYFERMVEELQDDEVDMAADEDVDSRRQSPVPPYDDQDPSAVKAELPSTWNAGSTSMELIQRIALLEEAREQLPFRTFGESSRGVDEWVTCVFCNLTGVHYLDSCPNVRDLNERFEIVMKSDLCKCCLERCPYEVCKYRYRDCWYCARVRGTIIEDLIPRDGGHHHALCNIPDAKPIIRRRIATAWKNGLHLDNVGGKILAYGVWWCNVKTAWQRLITGAELILWCIGRENENDIIPENANFMEGVHDDVNEPDNEDAWNEDNGMDMEHHHTDEPRPDPPRA
ncbi:hypothetical protein Y032_0049g1740 [Ancylostoma ceylanicum]|uniref:Uncharacterized protein n=1 Tax=Ancylostoma ceylanicum TaxID=53326 RepID=A0A016U9W8_9BILA|nr:hypothetical protein Y032_0049g1740 [Ancylostoma ceylanicum]